MFTRIMCGHCHEMNPAGARECANCGHNPSVPRMDCDCPKCLGGRGDAARFPYAPGSHHPLYGEEER
jgi:hypothetical protein